MLRNIQRVFAVFHCPPCSVMSLMCHLKLWHTISECWTNFGAMLQNATFFKGGRLERGISEAMGGHMTKLFFSQRRDFLAVFFGNRV